MGKSICCIALAGIALATAAPAATLINGAGATFPYPIYSKWFDEFHKKLPDIQINYQSIGSGGGIRQVQEGTVDFGATDGPMNDEQLQQAKPRSSTCPPCSARSSPPGTCRGSTNSSSRPPRWPG